MEDLAEEIRQVFEDLQRGHVPGDRCVLGDWTPAVDVFETTEAFEIRVGLPGIAADSVRVLAKDGTVAIVGEKIPPAPVGPGTRRFHVVERSFGRFARAIRLGGAVDAGRGRATLQAGELHVVVPKIPERRGKDILIPIESAS